MQNNYQTKLNILKRREQVRRLSQVPSTAANIAYTAFSPVTSETSISLIDKSHSLVANIVDDSRQIIASDTQTVVTDTEHFVITDVFVQSSAQSSIPLFWKHVVSTEHVSRTDPRDLTLSAGYQILEVEILDTFMSVVKNAAVVIDRTKGIIYSNFRQRYENSGDYDLYYVRYTVRVNNTETFSYVELLSQQPVYSVATFDDIELSGQIKAGRKVYFIEENATNYTVTLPTISTYGVKRTEDAQIKIKKPSIRGASDPWYVRVSNGSFKQAIGADVYKFYIAEFLGQAFYPSYPYKPSIWEISTFMNTNLVKLDNSNVIISDPDGFHLQLTIDNRDGTPAAAFTTDSSIVGDIAPNGKAYQKWTYENQVGIRSLAYDKGIVEVDGITLDSTQTIKASYTYIETDYEFTRIDNNPLTNSDISDTTMVLFLQAEPALSTLSQTLFYLLVDRDGQVVGTDCSVLLPYLDPAQQPVVGKLYYKDKPVWGTGTWTSFSDTMTIQTGGEFFILGEVSRTLDQSFYDVTTLDTRVRGGGIIESRINEALEIQPEILWYADLGFWDGAPFPDAANYVVEIPIDTIKGAGGVLTGPQITEIVRKHTAAGVYPVIRGYGIEVDIVDVLYDNTTGLTLRWSSHGNPLALSSPSASTRFNVYTKSETSTHWTLQNGTPILVSTPYTELILTGLLPAVKYQIAIVPGIIQNSTFVPMMSQPIGTNSDEAFSFSQIPDSHITVQIPTV